MDSNVAPMSQAPPRISEEVRRLLTEHVDSLEKLELLLLLTERPRESWTVEAAAAAIRLPARPVREAVDELRAAGLIRMLPGRRRAFSLAAMPVELEAACQELCTAYQEDRVEILKLTSRLAIDRVRESAANAFADAFRLRKRRTEGDGDG